MTLLEPTHESALRAALPNVKRVDKCASEGVEDRGGCEESSCGVDPKGQK